jgi:hypothetical protein
MVVLSQVKSWNISKGSVFVFKFPETSLGEKEVTQPPYQGTTLIPFLVAKGVVVRYEYKGAVCDVRTLWRDRSDFDIDIPALSEFFVDGISMGKGEEALYKITEQKWGRFPSLQVLSFGGRKFPYRTDHPGHPGWPFYMSNDLVEKLYKMGVRVEVYIGEPPAE